MRNFRWTTIAVLAAIFTLCVWNGTALAACGDTVLDVGEQCDDGNLIDGDGCDSNCTSTGCGNTIVTAGETCDDGNVLDGDGCDSNCTPTGCGNAIVTVGESCDDGNLVSGDGCDANCTPTGCGNTIVTGSEACDDGPFGSATCDVDCTAVACGDSTLNPVAGEQCDDGNVVSGDGCDDNCTLTGCGNGIATAGEACDDGNLVNGDGCDSNCTPTGCGNAILTAGEACDDGNLVSGDGCDDNCTLTGCGNGVVTAGEACDDGNLVSGDGCDGNCTATACGNGILTAGETCDDGNVASGDGCDANCTPTACGNGITTGTEQCDDGNLTSGDGCDSNCKPTACGNGIVTAPEQCDDGNLVSGDGCDSNCTAPGCGNGVVVAPEQCDDGNLVSGDGCDGNCKTTACGNGIVTTGETCDDGNGVSGDGCDANCTPTACGNSITAGAEQCDDGNVVSGDGCDANCTTTACGNGIIAGTEVCDDGNLVSGDGCDSNCAVTACGNGVVTAGETCDDGNLVSGDGCDANCTGSGCGNGIIAGIETCDDGNLVNGDGCDSTCLSTGCGSGVVTGIEQCDDGNVVSGDGCSALCQRELLNPVPAAGDRFGYSLATVGPNIVVGVPLHDQINAINTGFAYLYSTTTFQPLKMFANPQPNPADQFGFSVGGVGQNVLVGAPFDGTAGTNAGAVYLFNGVSGALIRTFLNPAGNGNKNFGWAIATLDASTVLISAPLDDTGLSGGGVVYAYNVGTGALIQVYLNPTPTGGDGFGSALTVIDGNVVVGEPGYDIPGGGFTPAVTDAGAVDVFNANTGALIKTIVNPAPVNNDRFGHAVAPFGSDLLASAPNSNAGAVYRIDTTSGTTLNRYRPPQPVGDDAFGTSITVLGGNTVAVGAIRGDAASLVNTGVVLVFDADTETLLETITKATPAPGDEFGFAITTANSYLVVGAPLDDTVDVDAGAVYFFRDNSCGNGQLGPLEQCDDGNLVSGDGCDTNCKVTACGNGVITAPEQCDDGNNAAGDGCSPICGLESSCGDGVITPPFEQCDDSNLVNGDGCDANCTPTACGNGLKAGAEQCDAGAANGSNLCCSATCQLIDADGDGICDPNDVCPNTADPAQSNLDGDLFGNACDICPGDVNNDSDNDLFCTGSLFNPPAVGGGDPCARTGTAGTWTKPKALFRHLDTPAGNERLVLKGLFHIGGLLPVIAPEVNGVHIRVTDADGGLVVDEKIPGGPNWKVGGAFKNQWSYKDRFSPPGHNGINLIALRSKLKDPTLFKVLIRGEDGTYPIQPGKEPLRVTVELNSNALPAGGTPGRDQCGEVQFLEIGKPICKFTGFKLLCK